MTDFLFFVKTFALCLVITLFMQLKVDKFTLEDHAHSFLQDAAVMLPLQTVAHGGAKLIHDATQFISQSIHRNVKNDKGEEVKDKKSTSTFLWQGSAK
jgi:hypothetical protein